MTAYEHNNWYVKFIFFYLYLTVRGMMYYRKAIKLQAFMDMAEDDGAFYHWLRLFYHYYHGDLRLSINLVQHLLNLIFYWLNFFFWYIWKTIWKCSICLICQPDILQGYDVIEKGNDTLSAQLDAVADMKFTHIISCQMFGSHKSSGNHQAQDILDLMIKYFWNWKRNTTCHRK